MEQQIQKGVASQTNAGTEIQQPQGAQMQPVKKKGSKWLIWLIIALVVIGGVVGSYFLFFK